MRIVLALVAILSLAADWPQYLGPNRDGSSNETGLLRTFPKDGPKFAWEKKAGSGWSGPVVAGNNAILFHRVENQEVVECVEAATGKGKWRKSYRARYRDDFGFDDGPRSTPSIADGRVFTLGADGDLGGWELSTGKLLWQRNINADYKVKKAFFGVGTSPLIVGEKLLVNVGGKGAGVVAFEPATGKEIWKASNDAVSYSSPILAKIDGEQLAVFFTREGLLALTPEKGDVRYDYPWRPRNASSVNAAVPIVSDNRIFLSTSYNTGAILLAADKGKLQEIWKNDESLSCHYNTPVLVKGHLYGIDGRQEYGAKLRCVDWKTGKVRWTEKSFGCATLTVVDGVILAMTESGDLVLFESSSDGYKELTRTPVLEKTVRAAIAMSDGKVFARDGGKWICINVKK